MHPSARVAYYLSIAALLAAAVGCSNDGEDESQAETPACAAKPDQRPAEHPVTSLSEAAVVNGKPVVLSDQGDQGMVAAVIDPATAKPCDTLTLSDGWEVQAAEADDQTLVFVASSEQEDAVTTGQVSVTEDGFGSPAFDDPIDELRDDPPYELAVAPNGNMAVRTDSQVAAVPAGGGATVHAAPNDLPAPGDPTDPSTSAETYRALAADDHGFATAVTVGSRSDVARYGWGGTRDQVKLETPEAGDVAGQITQVARSGGATLVLCSGASSPGTTATQQAAASYLITIDASGDQTLTKNVRTLAVGAGRNLATTTYDGAVRTFTLSNGSLTKKYASPAGTATGGVVSDGPHLYMLGSDDNGGTTTHITRIGWDFHGRQLTARADQVAIDRLAEAPGPPVAAFATGVAVVGVSDATGAVIPLTEG